MTSATAIRIAGLLIATAMSILVLATLVTYPPS